VDREYAEPVLAAFEAEHGIRVLPVYDVEAAKTTGLVNRLIAERDTPRADVFWSGEVSQTVLLKEKGLLAAYCSTAAADLPPTLQDPEGFWHGFGGRVRVLLVNPALLPNATVDSVFDLADPSIPADLVGIALPLFGTSATHASALSAAIGDEAAADFYRSLRSRGVRVVDGNSVVRDLVAGGQLAVGLTDSDDACGAVRRGAKVRIVVPDQDGMGAFVIPNTVALVAGGPNPDEGRRLVDYLIAPDVEARLIDAGWIQVPSHAGLAAPPCPDLAGLRRMNVSYQETAAHHAETARTLADTFLG
jgi:iron(III) transport system substrate-binding protein